MSACNVCGAPRDPIELKCKYCNTAFTSNGVVGGSHIEALRNILEKIDQEERAKSPMQNFTDGFVNSIKKERSPSLQAKLNAISTFAMPSDTENLLQFFMFCHGNASINIEWDDKAGGLEKEAWTGKAKMAFGQLKLLSGANSEISRRIEDYEKLYGLSAKKKLPKQFWMIVIGGLLLIGFIFIVTIGVMSERDSKKIEAIRIETSIGKTQQLFSDKKYEAALMEASNIAWRESPNTNKEKVKMYDLQREELVANIKKILQEQSKFSTQADPASQAQEQSPPQIANDNK